MEVEALAAAWGLKKPCLFTPGNEKIMVCVNYQSLLKILGDRELGDIDNPRMLNF